MIESIVIGAFFCIIGFLLQAYEIHFVLFSKKYTYAGLAFDINQITGKYKNESTDRIRNFDFKGDFQRKQYLIYNYPKMELRITQNKVKIQGKIHVLDSKNNLRKANLKGKGKFLTRGLDGSGFCYIEVQNWDSKSNWRNIYLLNFTVTKELRGYWITENTINKGTFVMGRLMFFLEEH